ncbi:hypothetical protein KQH54_02480 [bacterium]|nr:hypothetical protein [bacterium]
MKRSQLIFGLTVLIIGLLAAGCGGADINNGETNNPVTNNNDQSEVETPTENLDEPITSDDELPAGPTDGGIIVNLPGEIPYQDQDRGPGQGKLSEGNVFLSNTQLLIMESYPVQVAVDISGDLPTPCNQLTVDIAEPNADNQIYLNVYSLVDPAMTCIAVLDPFIEQVHLPMDNLADGTYEVWVNGTLVGEFTYPG